MEYTIEQITELQKQHGMTEMQNMINNGNAWHMEGSYGRAAMENLEMGSCMLPEERHKDYWGNTVPSRNDLKPGTKGTQLNCQNFWTKVEDGEIQLVTDADEGEEQ
jgi:hypothetical protein